MSDDAQTPVVALDTEPCLPADSQPAPGDRTRQQLANLRPFPKGQSGNPAGRARSLYRAVRRVAGKDGAKLVAGLWTIALGSAKERKDFFGESVRVNTRERIAALSELLDRGWGKPAQSLDLTGATSGVNLVVITGVPPAEDEHP